MTKGKLIHKYRPTFPWRIMGVMPSTSAIDERSSTREINFANTVNYHTDDRSTKGNGKCSRNPLVLGNRKALHVPSYSYNKTVDTQKGKQEEKLGLEQKKKFVQEQFPGKSSNNNFFARNKPHTINSSAFRCFLPPSRDHRKTRKRKESDN